LRAEHGKSKQVEIPSRIENARFVYSESTVIQVQGLAHGAPKGTRIRIQFAGPKSAA
jgi:hypothetical protein